MKKIITGLIFLGIINNVQAQNAAPMMMSTVAVSMAANASSQAHKAQNTIGLGVLAGKQIENCLILQAYWDVENIVCVCLNKNKDEVYSVRFHKSKGDFSKGVFDELRKQFIKKGRVK
jgi:hypothetical protein